MSCHRGLHRENQAGIAAQPESSKISFDMTAKMIHVNGFDDRVKQISSAENSLVSPTCSS
jgi:hypothetical protein